MSIKRYQWTGPEGWHAEALAGDWVRYDDHAREVSKRMQQIEELRDNLTACQLDRDRLDRKCGALALLLYGCPGCGAMLSTGQQHFSGCLQQHPPQGGNHGTG